MRPKTARLANLVLAGTLTGNELGTKIAVHPALGDLPPQVHMEAEQAMTRRYGRVMPVFMTATLASFLPVLALERPSVSLRFLLTAAGMGCYAAMLAVTLSRNVPINNRLLELSPQAGSHDEFGELRARWDRLHTTRNLLNLTGLACTALAALTSTR